MSQNVGNAKNVDGLERRLYKSMEDRTIEDYEMRCGLLLTDVGRKVGEYEGGQFSMCISYALPSDSHCLAKPGYCAT